MQMEVELFKFNQRAFCNSLIRNKGNVSILAAEFPCCRLKGLLNRGEPRLKRAAKLLN